ncbi:MAG: hypothetical protein NTY20_05730 [Candidatus Aenigmarchaeota archaeon]|nr:hypothetical protein [Candidatus Aenigmarchaeota archaeon]
MLIITFSIVSVPAKALELEYYGIESSINDDMTVKTVLTIKFREPVNNSEFMLGYKAFNLTSTSSFDSAKCTLTDEANGSRTACTFSGMTDSKNLLTLTFYTKDGISAFQGKYNFSVNYGISAPINEAFILIKIPRSSSLSEEPANQSYLPSDGKILSDGKYIMVYWQRENLTATDDMRFSVSYAIPSAGAGFSNLFVVSIAGIVIISMIAVAIYVRRGDSLGKTTAEVVASVLNTDEKKVVDILARHGGRSGQKIIVRESDFSKAKVSRLVKNLKERGIVDIEPISGRENRIILKFEKKPESDQKPDQKPERLVDPVIETQADVEEEI